MILDFVVFSAVCVLPMLLRRRWDLLPIGVVSAFAFSLAEPFTFRGVRDSNPIMSWSGFLFLVGGFVYLMYFSAPRGEVRSTRKRVEGSRSVILLIGIILAAILLRVYVAFTHPFLIVDVGGLTEELVDGVLSGVNPYPSTLVPYGSGVVFYYLPFVYFFKSSVVRGFFESFLVTYLKHYHLGIKVGNMFAEVVVAFVLYRLGRDVCSDETGLLLSFLYLFHPVFVFEGYVQGTNDFPALMFLLVSLYFVLNQRFLASALFLGIGTAVKWVPGLVLPFVLYFVWSKGGGRRIIMYVVVFLVSFTTLFLPLFLLFPSFLSDITDIGLMGFIEREVYPWEYMLSIYRPIIPFFELIDVLSLIFPLLFYLAVLGLFLFRRPIHENTVLCYSGLAVASVFLFSRSIHRNYYILFLPLLIVSATISRTRNRKNNERDDSKEST